MRGSLAAAARSLSNQRGVTSVSLFNSTTNQWFGTNDDAAGLGSDSKLTGTLTAGDYLAVVDNLSETANNLTYQLVLTSP